MSLAQSYLYFLRTLSTLKNSQISIVLPQISRKQFDAIVADTNNEVPPGSMLLNWVLGEHYVE